MAEENLDHIDELQKKLFSRNEKLIPKKKPGTLHENPYQASRDWTVAKIVRPTADRVNKTLSASPSLFKKIFLGSVAFFVIALAFAFFVFRGGSNSVSADNIDIAILGNTFTGGGEDLQLQVAVTNRNPVALEYSDLVIEYPKGAEITTNAGDMVRVRQQLGTVEGGKSIMENIKVTLFGEEGSTKDIKATLEYRVKGSNAIFVKEKKYTVTISSAPLNLSIEGPTETNSNQEVALELTVRSNATKLVENVAIRASYPPGFQFTKAEPEAADGNNIWNLGDIAPGVEKKITITGIILGQDNEERSFRFEGGELDPDNSSEIAVVYSSLLHTLKIARPFVQTQLLINGTNEASSAVSSGNIVSGTVQWTNNSPARVENVSIKAKLSGNALNKASVISNDGFYNSLTNEITWDRNTTTKLLAIEPGESGTLTFTFKPLALFSQNRTLLENPEITIQLSMGGMQTISGSAPTQINNIETKTIKVNSDMQIAAQAMYHTGPFTNTGTLPPRADLPTTYTINWTVNNSANGISGAEAKTTLPLYVTWANAISPANENVFYNSTTREVTWRIGQVPRGAGYTGDSREASFQVKLIPSISQVGSSPALIGETRLTGTDTFTGKVLEAKKSPITTDLFNDPGFPSNGGTVIQ